MESHSVVGGRERNVLVLVDAANVDRQFRKVRSRLDYSALLDIIRDTLFPNEVRLLTANYYQPIDQEFIQVDELLYRTLELARTVNEFSRESLADIYAQEPELYKLKTRYLKAAELARIAGFGYSVIVRPMKQVGTIRRGDLDAEIAATLIEEAHLKQYDTFVLLSGDGDFGLTIERVLRLSHTNEVYVISALEASSHSLQQTATGYIDWSRDDRFESARIVRRNGHEPTNGVD